MSEYDRKVLDVPWFAQPNDLIGGWCVMTANIPPSKADGQSVVEVLDCASEGTARHVAQLHNAHLANRQFSPE